MTKTYTGRRLPDGTTSVVVAEHLEHGTRGYSLPHHPKHSPDGFNWGYGGSGPSELARCILIDHCGLREEAAVVHPDWNTLAEVESSYQEFKAEMIVPMEGDTWEITTEEIMTWLSRRGAAA